MVFERIITVNGHQYKYLVMSVRDGKKVKQKTIKYLGKVDKDKDIETDSPYGLYYFAQESCEACQSERQVNHTLYWAQRVIKDETLPKLHYVNFTHDKNPLSIDIAYTPTAIEITRKRIFKGRDFDIDWLQWRYGKEKGTSIKDASHAAWSQAQDEISAHIMNGKGKGWLIQNGYLELDVLTPLEADRRIKRDKRLRDKVLTGKTFILSKECVIGKPVVDCNVCKYGELIFKGSLKGYWMCNEYEHDFKCGNDSCKLEKPTKCDICGFVMWNKYVFDAHMKEVHTQKSP